MNKLISILSILFIFLLAIISFIWVVGCWFANYVPDIFFYKTVPFAIICAGALIALAISSRHAVDKSSDK